MAHACKPGAADKLFAIDHPERGQLQMKAYDCCVTLESARPSAGVFPKQCGSSGLQRFLFELDGRIRLAGSEACLTVANEDGIHQVGLATTQGIWYWRPATRLVPLFRLGQFRDRTD